MIPAYAVDRERWGRMSILEQMGNIYSEIGRSFSAKHRKDEVGYEQAVARAIDLFDATAQILVKRHSPRAKEVLRAKEEFLGICSRDASLKEEQDIDRYFMQFAVAARLHR